MIIYTIQNGNGDYGWIQKINTESLQVEDEITGEEYKYNPFTMQGQFLEINKQEYGIIEHLITLLNINGYEEYLEMANDMIEVTIKQNKENVFEPEGMKANV
jgi:hypothetical protein